MNECYSVYVFILVSGIVQYEVALGTADTPELFHSFAILNNVTQEWNTTLPESAVTPGAIIIATVR